MSEKIKPLRFEIEWEAELNGESINGVESEASWFLVDQRGGFYSHGPMRPVTPCDSKYEKLLPKILIGKRYLSVNDIESELEKVKAERDRANDLLKQFLKGDLLSRLPELIRKTEEHYFASLNNEKEE